jgi:2'-5' RNA ligase
MVRLFVSLELPKELISEIIKIQNKFKEKNFFVGKFTEKENLHLTLKFLGGISEDKINEIKNKLSKIKFKKFDACLGEIGFFSERIFWVELLGKDAFNLQKKIDNALSDLFSKEKRFMSHITIARIKNIKDKKEFENFVKKICYSKKNYEISGFSLKKSVLSDKGGEYETLIKID